MITDFEAFLNPSLGGLLRALGLDKTFVRGDGLRLYDVQGTEYLDFVGAYGALPFGHNCAAMTAALKAALDDAEPTLVQPSALASAGLLARRLVERAPGRMVACCFANSGAEAVEAAIKVAYARTRRRGILTTRRGFHGKTLGALSATWNPHFQDVFHAPLDGFAAVPYGDEAALTAHFAAHGDELAAFIVEPIQGEAGIIVPPASYLATARRLCDQYGALLIVDEVQTGLGRTGRLFACEELAGGPDILTLSKALGGGLIPIGACLVGERAYSDEFGLKHSSTFAGNALGCRMGLATLQRLDADGGALLADVARHGATLKAGLSALASQHPGTVAEVRGEGLLLGLELGPRRGTHEPRFGSYLPILNEQNALAPLAASYLLNVERIRVAPALSGGQTLRIEPPLTVGEADIARLLDAVGRLLRLIERRDTGRLLAHLCTGGAAIAEVPSAPAVNRLDALPDDGAPRFAFLVHPLATADFADFDTSLRGYPEAAREAFEATLLPLVEPFVAASTTCRTVGGATAHGEFIMVPRTAQQLMSGNGPANIALIQQAVDLAAARGAQIIGLGAYTSIVTRGGTSLRSTAALTTGNSCTMIASVEATKRCLAARGKALGSATVSVVGAAGSIGSSAARLFLAEAGALCLVGNPASRRANAARFTDTLTDALRYVADLPAKQRRLAGSLAQAVLARPEWTVTTDLAGNARRLAEVLIAENGSHLPLHWTNDGAVGVGMGDAVFIATNNTARFIRPEDFRPDAVACDISRPANLAMAIRDLRPDVLTIDGGLVSLATPVDLGADFGIAPGRIYACMAETMMLALDRRFVSTSLGLALDNEDLQTVRQLMDRHGFALAEPTSFDLPIDLASWSTPCDPRYAAGRATSTDAALLEA